MHVYFLYMLPIYLVRQTQRSACSLSIANNPDSVCKASRWTRALGKRPHPITNLHLEVVLTISMSFVVVGQLMRRYYKKAWCCSYNNDIGFQVQLNVRSSLRTARLFLRQQKSSLWSRFVLVFFRLHNGLQKGTLEFGLRYCLQLSSWAICYLSLVTELA